MGKSTPSFIYGSRAQAGWKVWTASSPRSRRSPPRARASISFSPGITHHLHQVMEVVDHHTGELFGVGQSAGENDCVNKLGEAAQHDAHPLAIWRA